jgi:hypothetical protein
MHFKNEYDEGTEVYEERLEREKSISIGVKVIVTLLILLACYFYFTNKKVEDKTYVKTIYYFKLGNEYVEADNHFIEEYKDQFVICVFTKDKKKYKTCDFKTETITLTKEKTK